MSNDAQYFTCDCDLTDNHWGILSKRNSGGNGAQFVLVSWGIKREDCIRLVKNMNDNNERHIQRHD